MPDIGELLKTTRERKHLSLEQAAHETSIARRYLEALENDEYDVFPGEPYILGFLRNYCEYLQLDTEQCIARYKHLKIQEMSLTTETLLPSKRWGSFPLLKGVACVLFLGGVLGVYYARHRALGFLSRIVFFGRAQRTPRELSPPDATGAVRETVSLSSAQHEERARRTRSSASRYTLAEEKFEHTVFPGDVLVISSGGNAYELTVSRTTPHLYLDTPIGTQVISLGQRLVMDLNTDVQPDVEISVEDIEAHQADGGARVRVFTGSLVQTLRDRSAQSFVPTSGVNVSGQTGVAAGARYQVLFEGGVAYPVTMNATFRSYCLFRYEADRTRREERYYQKGEQLTVQANNGIRVWASNGNVVQLQIVAGGKTVDVGLSRPGEVLVKDIKWIKDEDAGRFKFVVMEVD